jgi:DNA-binding MarR family transcriptional regulator
MSIPSSLRVRAAPASYRRVAVSGSGWGARMSKPAMNQLLRSLEGLGYIARSDAPDQGRSRIIRFTKRGRAACSKIYDILGDIKHEWSAELGPRHFSQLKELLSRA